MSLDIERELDIACQAVSVAAAAWSPTSVAPGRTGSSSAPRTCESVEARHSDHDRAVTAA
jgi:hypothetical protein